MNREGDTIQISGNYQHRAVTEGFVVQRFWHREKERIIGAFSKPQPGERALDVGCGSGVVSDYLASLGARVTGVDVNAEAIDFAECTFRRPNLDFRRALVEDLPYEEGSIDRIYCLEVVEHLYEPQVQNLLGKFRKLMRPGGILTLTTPNYRGFWPALELAMDRLGLAPPMADHQHVTKFHRAKLRELLSPGWNIQRLSTFCTVAPFLSALNWRLAERCAALEDKMDFPFGNLLLVVATKNGADSSARN